MERTFVVGSAVAPLSATRLWRRSHQQGAPPADRHRDRAAMDSVFDLGSAPESRPVHEAFAYESRSERW